MSSTRPRSARRQPPPPPPKKSHVGLIILIIVIILVVIAIIIIIILVLRARNSGKCTTNANCPTGKVCSAGTCILGTACTTDANCGTGQICNTTSSICVAGCTSNAGCGTGTICTSGQCVSGCVNNAGCATGQVCTSGHCVVGTSCTSASDCSGSTPACVSGTCVQCAGTTDTTSCPAASPICTAGNTCTQCATSTDCSGNPIYSTQALNVCNSGSCIGCLTNTDCTGTATCVSGTCCNKTAPTISPSIASTLPTTGTSKAGTFTGSFTYVQNPTGVKYQVLVGLVIADATFSIVGTTMTVTSFDTTQYPIAVGQYIYAPGVTGLPMITALGTGTGGAGTYTIDTAQTVASVAGGTMYKYYTTPTAQNSGLSPQTFTISNADLGHGIEPGTTYFFGIQMTVICGSTNTIVSSNWANVTTPNPSSGIYPLDANFPNPPDGLWITSSTTGWLCQNIPSGYTDPTVQMWISKWTHNNNALMGILPGTFKNTAVNKVSQVQDPVNSLNGPGWLLNSGSGSAGSGVTFYLGFNPWGPMNYYGWNYYTVTTQ